MTRNEMVEWLVNNDIQYIQRQLAEGDEQYLRDILMGDGFTPYSLLTNEYLEGEVETRKEFENDDSK